LEELRERIDALDREILARLNERAQCALEIGRLKSASESNFYVPEREKRIYDKLRDLNEGPLPEDALRSIYREIISAARALEKPVDVAFLGPLYTFSHMAMLRVFGSHSTPHPVASMGDIFTEVERRRADYGVVPVENSMGGGVGDTLDRFVVSDLTIVNEVMLHITHNLLANSELTAVKRLYSHPQPLLQCRNWLKANLPNAEVVETSSTSEAARKAAEEDGAGAISSALAAEAYGLGIVSPGIEDNAQNYTRFLVVSRHSARRTGQDKTSVICSVKDRPGALLAILEPFEAAGVNLTKIESRPSRRKAWDYVFFIDMAGHTEDEAVREALTRVAEHCKELKVLGSYPIGEMED
jgi:chorismate mutase/prephenate dehydratase